MPTWRCSGSVTGYGWVDVEAETEEEAIQEAKDSVGIDDFGKGEFLEVDMDVECAEQLKEGER